MSTAEVVGALWCIVLAFMGFLLWKDERFLERFETMVSVHQKVCAEYRALTIERQAQIERIDAMLTKHRSLDVAEKEKAA